MKLIIQVIASVFLFTSNLVSAQVMEKPLLTVDSLIAAGSSDSALTLLHTTIEDSLMRTSLNKNNIANAYLNLSKLYYKKRKYETAYIYADTSNKIIVSDNMSDTKLKGEIYEMLGKVLRRLRKPKDAQVIFEKLLSLYQNTYNEPHHLIARTLNLLALAQRESGDNQASVISAKYAIRVSQSLGTSENTKTAQYCNTLARAMQKLNQLDEAATYYLKAIELSIPTLGKDNIKLTAYYNNLGNVYSNLGRFTEALENYTIALTIREEHLGLDDMKVAQSLNNIALVYYNINDFVEAESRYRRAMNIFKDKLGQRHEYVGAMNMNLGALYLDQRRFADAEEVLLEGMSIFNEIDPDGHPQIAGILNNLAIVCRNTDRILEAKQYLHKALSLKINRYGNQSPRVASTLNSLGVLAFSQGEYETAEKHLNQALILKQTAFDETHPEIGGALLNLGELFSYQNRWLEADSLFEQATTIWTSVYGSSNRWIAEVQERRAVSLRRQGKFQEAWDLLKKAYDIRLDLFTKNVRILSEPDALAFSTFLRHTTDLLLSTWIDLGTSSQRDSVIALVVFSNKGIVWDELAQRAKSLQINVDPETIELVNQLRSTRFQLARAYVTGPPENHQNFHFLLDSLADQAEEFESLLAQRDSRYHKRMERTKPSITAITAQLPDQSAIVDYIRFNYWPSSETKPIPHYISIVLSTDNLQSLSLGPADPIDNRVEDYRQHFLDIAALGEPMPGDQENYTDIATDLYSVLITPINEYISGEKNLLLAPVGPLCLISWAGLMPDSTSYLLEQYDISYLGSGRDLLNTTSVGTEKNGLLAVGDVDFNFSNDNVQDTDKVRYYRNGGMPLSPLKGSREEVNAIASSWRESRSDPVELLMASEATESAFKEKATQYNILHIATHGFYDSYEPNIESYNLMDYTSERPIVENPMLRSGLYFAGVNTLRNNQSSDSEDGVLTAMEISNLDLTGTDIVVLSGCETGLGTILEGEGVSGLRRAFHIAGTETVVCALWQISDSRTALMMKNLYNDNTLEMNEQLLKFQRMQLLSMRSAGEPDHPFYWASFIVISQR